MDIVRIIQWFQPKAKKQWRIQEEYLRSFHYMYAWNLYHQGQDEDACKELCQELKMNPQNGAAHLMMADLHYRHADYGNALKSANSALANLEPTKNAKWLSKAYYRRGLIYRSLSEPDKLREDILKSLTYDPESDDALFELGNYYFNMKQYDSSDIYFGKMTEIKPYNPIGYLGLGCNLQARNEHLAAIGQFDKAIKVDNCCSSAYAFKAESLYALGKKTDAFDAIITSLIYDKNEPSAHALMAKIGKDDIKGLLLKIKAQAIAHPDDESWYRIFGWECLVRGEMKEGTLAYHNAYKINKDSELLDFEAFCLSKMGAFDKALEVYDEAIAQDPKEYNYKSDRAKLFADFGRYNEAIAASTECAKLLPDDHNSYYSRGRIFFETGRYEEAIEDFDTALSVKDSMAVALLYKGWALSETGWQEEAENVWQSIVEKEEQLEEGQHAIGLALLFLGHEKEAVEKCNVLAEQSDDKIQDKDFWCYVAAVYARTQHTDLAIGCLKKGLATGMVSLWPVSHNRLLEPLFANKDFQQLIKAEEERQKEDREYVLAQLESAPVPQRANIKAEIPFVRENKMCKVPCEVNGLPLHFIFDTGASDISMSSVEATFMLKNGYLEESDLSGKEYYSIADGSIAEGTKVCLRNVVFAGVALTNVKAGIVSNLKAPLLLGQSVLERLGRIEIDNDNMLLKINS